MSKNKTMHFCETIEAVPPATDELRRLLDERGIEYCDYYRDLTYFRLIPDVEDDFFTTVEETYTHKLVLKVGFKSPKQAVDAIQAIAATLGDTDATRERQGDAGTCRPCPFCGGEAEIAWEPLLVGDFGAVVTCKKCHAATHAFKEEEDAITAWNRRAGDA